MRMCANAGIMFPNVLKYLISDKTIVLKPEHFYGTRLVSCHRDKMISGIYRDMTLEEIAELEKLATEMPAPEPTPEERIAALEQANAELREALDALLTGVTA